MRFSILKTATAALAFIGGAQAVIKHDELVDRIKSLADKTEALAKPAEAVTLADLSSFATGKGPSHVAFLKVSSDADISSSKELVGGFIEIVSIAANTIPELSGAAKISSDAGIDAVTAAFDGLAKASKTLFNILAEKLKIFGNIPVVGQAISAVLGAAQKIINELANGVISLVDGKAEKLKSVTGGLENAFEGIVGDFAKLLGA
ncbi:unnamed protein product [Parascedosporium putredinis]|uniref:Uncharacterized protein n=1 Tax=Parascedosporium putredinis TaxID=1442378 RepID=A0A9P1HBD7_9PEZI|nr:unnamed protein product [Parascedosporium putredinis]CAI8004856.1 unnamed protein product [Parascedosporium putredinis]